MKNRFLTHTLFGVAMGVAALICLYVTSVQADTGGSEHRGLIYRNPRAYNVEYSFEMFPDPNKIDRSKDLKLWVPIPRQWNSQKAVKIISVEPQPHARYTDPEHGNPMLFWDFGKEPEQDSYRVKIKYRLESYEIHADIDPNRIGPYDKTSQDYALYTRSTHTISITDKVREFAQIAIGDEKNPYLQAKRICEFVSNKMKYKYIKKSGVQPLLDSPFKDETTGEEYYGGSCVQYSAFFVALCRAVGIPARSVGAFVGWRPWKTKEDLSPLVKSEKLSSPNGLAEAHYRGVITTHWWAEIFIPGYGWIPADPTYNRFCHLGNKYIIFYKDRDIKVGPYTPQSQENGYGTVSYLLYDGRLDLFLPGVWNIAKVYPANWGISHHPDPFPADALAEYMAKLYPESENEKNLALYRKRTLRWIDENTREQTDKIAALAQAYKKEPKARFEHQAFICHMLRKVVGDKKFFDIFKTYTNLRVESGEPVSTERLQKIAEGVYGKPLDWFFNQWVGYTELPQLKLDEVTFSEEKEGLHVCGTLRQLNKSLFRLPVELALEAEKTVERKIIWIENRNTNFEFSTADRPKSVLVDPNNDILQIREMPPLLEGSSYDEVAYCIITDQGKADCWGWTPLHFAVQAGRTDIVEFLIANGADVNAKNLRGETSLYFAAENGRTDIVEFFIARGANVNVENLINDTPLHIAVRRDHKEIAKLLIEKGADVSLHIAAGLGDLARVKSLIEEGADVNAEVEWGETPLHRAAAKGHKEIIELLIAKGADVDANKPGYTPLTWAIWQLDYDSDKDIVEALVTHGADVNFKPFNDDPAIYYSVWNEDVQLAELLLAHGARLDVKDERGWTVLHHSVSEANRELIEFFLSRGATAPEFHLAACLGNLDRVTSLIEEGMDVDTKDELGWTPLYWAASMGREEVAKFLISKGAEVDVRTNDNRTPLHQAAKAGAAKLVELLISKGADPNARDKNDSTPLHSAAASGHKSIVEFLIIKGADVKAAEKSGNTPLHKAAMARNPETVELLIAKGADINATSNAGTPLHRAVARDRTNIVKILLAKGANVDAKDNRGRTALDLAIDKGHGEIAELLRKHGAKE